MNHLVVATLPFFCFLQLAVSTSKLHDSGARRVVTRLMISNLIFNFQVTFVGNYAEQHMYTYCMTDI